MVNIGPNPIGIVSRERIMKFIKTFIEKNGYAPTVREIANGVYLSSTSTVQRHLEILKKQGEITWNPKVSRTIRLIEKKKSDASTSDHKPGCEQHREA